MQTPGSRYHPFGLPLLPATSTNPALACKANVLHLTAVGQPPILPPQKRRAAGNFQPPFAERDVPFQSWDRNPSPTGVFQSHLADKMAAQPAAVNGGLLSAKGGARWNRGCRSVREVCRVQRMAGGARQNGAQAVRGLGRKGLTGSRTVRANPTESNLVKPNQTSFCHRRLVYAPF